MKQKRRSPTLVFKAIEESPTLGGVQVIREAHPSIAPQDAQEWALDVELDALLASVPAALVNQAPDSVERANKGLYQPSSSGSFVAKDSAFSSISSDVLAQVAAIQNRPRPLPGPSSPELSREGSAVAAPRPGVVADTFDIDEQVSRLIEARGTAKAPLSGRRETSSFPGLHAFESYAAPVPGHFVKQEQPVSRDGWSEAGGEYAREVGVESQPEMGAASMLSQSPCHARDSLDDLQDLEDIQFLPSLAERRSRGALAQRQMAPKGSSGASRLRPWLWLSGAALCGLSLAAFVYFRF